MAAAVEIAVGRVVDLVAASPVAIGRQGQDADGETDAVVPRARREERAVTAIVLEDEQADV